MYESSVINLLEADTELCSLLATYTKNNVTRPAIFDQEKPKEPPFPYLVITINKRGIDAVSRFSLQIDYFGYSGSTTRLKARQAVERVEFLLMFNSLTHERYDDIRHYECDIIPVSNEDLRAIQYSVRFEARAVESKFLKQIP